jgi:hypothetical protein
MDVVHAQIYAFLFLGLHRLILRRSEDSTTPSSSPHTHSIFTPTTYQWPPRTSLPSLPPALLCVSPGFVCFTPADSLSAEMTVQPSIDEAQSQKPGLKGKFEAMRLRGGGAGTFTLYSLVYSQSNARILGKDCLLGAIGCFLCCEVSIHSCCLKQHANDPVVFRGLLRVCCRHHL